METVGAYEAKTHLPKLLERVLKGERISITRHETKKPANRITTKGVFFLEKKNIAALDITNSNNRIVFHLSPQK